MIATGGNKPADGSSMSTLDPSADVVDRSTASGLDCCIGMGPERTIPLTMLSHSGKEVIVITLGVNKKRQNHQQPEQKIDLKQTNESWDRNIICNIMSYLKVHFNMSCHPANACLSPMGHYACQVFKRKMRASALSIVWNHCSEAG